MTEIYPSFPRYAPQRESLRSDLCEAMKTFVRSNPRDAKYTEIHVPADIEAELADYEANKNSFGKEFANKVNETWERLMNVRPAIPTLMGLRVIWDAKELKVS